MWPIAHVFSVFLTSVLPFCAWSQLQLKVLSSLEMVFDCES